MTRKHFTLLAAAIAEHELDPTTRRSLALAIGLVLASENPAFNLTAWLTACGTGEAKS